MNIEVNNVYVSDCLPFMQGMDSNSVDMVLTSPPYDNLRNMMVIPLISSPSQGNFTG